MMVNMFLVEELSYNEHKRKGSGCEAGRESAIARVREYRVDIITLKK